MQKSIVSHSAYRVNQTFYPLNFNGSTSQMTECFKIKFCMFIACSHLCKINKFYSVISNHDKVKLFSVFVGILPEYLRG